MNNKKRRNLKRVRDLLGQVTDKNRNGVLNTYYSVVPAAFESPQRQRKLRQIFPPSEAKHLSLAKLNSMRLHRRSNALKIAICCMPKSGSSFILSSLLSLPDLKFSIGYFHVPYDNPTFVDAVECENEIDEMALLRLEMINRNTLVHTHTKCSPYTENMIASHNYKTIVVQRNIFDCIVSMDDMICKGEVPGFGMFHPPTNYREFPREERLEFLCGYVGPWYVDFVATWARTRLNALFLRYEEDVLGFDERTVDKIRTAIGLQDIEDEAFFKAFKVETDQQKKRARLNVGVSGRGAEIPVAARDAVRRLADFYSRDADFTGLL